MARDTQQGRRVFAGILLLAGLLGCALLVFFLDDILRSTVRRYELVAVIGNAPGVTEGSPVWVGGRNVGAVTRVGFIPGGGDSLARLAITLELPRSAQQQVRADSRVRVASASLVGAPVIDVIPGSAAARMLRPGDTLRAEVRLTPRQVAARAAVVRVQLDSALQEVRRLAPAVGARIVAARRVFASLDAALADAGRLNASLRAGQGVALLDDPAFAASLARVQAHAAALSGAFADMRGRAGQVQEVRAAVARLQQRADSLSALLLPLTQPDPNSSLARMQQDSAIVRAITAARAELDSLMVEARRNPLRFVF